MCAASYLIKVNKRFVIFAFVPIVQLANNGYSVDTFLSCKLHGSVGLGTAGVNGEMITGKSKPCSKRRNLGLSLSASAVRIKCEYARSGIV